MTALNLQRKQNMTFEQVAFAGKALDEMKTISVASPTPHDGTSLSRLLTENDITYSLTDLTDLSATGFSSSGMQAIAQLAKSFRPDGSIRGNMLATRR